MYIHLHFTIEKLEPCADPVLVPEGHPESPALPSHLPWKSLSDSYLTLALALFSRVICKADLPFGLHFPSQWGP